MIPARMSCVCRVVRRSALRCVRQGDALSTQVARGPSLRSSALGPRASGGFSLIELLLVIALIAVIGVFAATALSGGMDGIRLRAAAKEVAAQLRFTRAQAIATGRPQRFSIDPRAHTWTAPRDRSGDIPSQLGIVFTGARETQPARGVGAIVFFADGASTGGRIQLNAKSAAWNVDVKWLTGEVRLHRGEVQR